MASITEAFATTNSEDPDAIFDSGASRHYCPKRSMFVTYDSIKPEPIVTADGRSLATAVGKGDIRLEFPMGPGQLTRTILLRDVYYVPEMAYILVSAAQIDAKGHSILIENGSITIRSPRPKCEVIGCIPLIRGLYRISDNNPIHHANVALLSTLPISISKLHRRLGHVNHDALRQMVINNTVHGVDLDLTSKPEPCLTCIKAKMPRNPFPKHSDQREHLTKYGAKVVMDVWGPAPVVSYSGARYALNFIDVATCEPRSMFIAKKSQAFKNYLDYEAWVKVQRHAIIEILGSDQGGEFMSDAFINHLKRQGTIRHLNVHDSPQSSGMIERGHRTQANDVRAMMISAGIPQNLWTEAWNYSNWLRTRTPTRRIPDSITPLEKATGERPDLSLAREWGSQVWVKRLKVNKFASRMVEGRFIGVDDEAKGIRVWWPSTRQVTLEHDIYFDPNDGLSPGNVIVEGEQQNRTNHDAPEARDQPNAEQPPKHEPENAEKCNVDVRNGDQHANEPQQQPNAPAVAPAPPDENTPPDDADALEDLYNSLGRLPNGLDRPALNTGRGFRVRRPAGYYKAVNDGKAQSNAAVELEFVALLADIDRASMMHADNEPWDGDWDGEAVIEWDVEGKEWFGALREFACSAAPQKVRLPPMTPHEAYDGPEGPKWQASTHDELTGCEVLHTWDLVVAPPDANIVKSRYVYRYKLDADGEITRYKTRLVAKGYSQIYGVNYFEIFAPVVKLSTLRVILAFAAKLGSVIHQADAKSAYLNSRKLREKIYMELPPRYEEFRTLPAHLKKQQQQGQHIVCQLRKPLYGTKQGANEWYQTLRAVFIKLGYKVCDADEAVFYKFGGQGAYVIVAAATDDFTIVADTRAAAELLKKQLNSHFEIVDLGEINWLLGIHMTRDLKAGTISLGQQAFIDRILEIMGLQDA
ncbi:hypothetical protein HGRIS_014893 [Hohenbuehelia grisea]|uniref:Integrase catalytic domain-containing protein n=1 Tax=Hohenbuehelia grisea TaxID=104357 RepID=A0ABR3IPP6_9AGAR